MLPLGWTRVYAGQPACRSTRHTHVTDLNFIRMPVFPAIDCAKALAVKKQLLDLSKVKYMVSRFCQSHNLVIRWPRAMAPPLCHCRNHLHNNLHTPNSSFVPSARPDRCQGLQQGRLQGHHPLLIRHPEGVRRLPGKGCAGCVAREVLSIDLLASDRGTIINTRMRY